MQFLYPRQYIAAISTDIVNHCDRTAGDTEAVAICITREHRHIRSAAAIYNVIAGAAFKSVVAMQNAKKAKLPTDFKNVLARFNQARAKAPQKPVPGNGRLAPPTLSLDARLKNSKMVNLLTGRTWSLYSKTTGEQWFFEFRSVGPISYAQGKCTGKRGNKIHNWKQWIIRDAVLVIEGSARYVFDNVTQQWKQSDGGGDTVIR